ncbi:MAG TPA: DUF6285 domain-containing protein, partial [Acidimicrobiales bacterium]|nr:DUF6285 domain-containing protein [Acidimicrobiales bacterium]
GRLSFLSRVAANVVAMVGREVALGPAQADRRARELAAVGVGSEAELATALAAGRFDETEAELRDVLASGVAARLAVANPGDLTDP